MQFVCVFFSVNVQANKQTTVKIYKYTLAKGWMMCKESMRTEERSNNDVLLQKKTSKSNPQTAKRK